MSPSTVQPAKCDISESLAIEHPSPNLAFNRTPGYASSCSRAAVAGRRLT
jgi:hypothetical protein